MKLNQNYPNQMFGKSPFARQAIGCSWQSQHLDLGQAQHPETQMQIQKEIQIQMQIQIQTKIQMKFKHKYKYNYYELRPNLDSLRLGLLTSALQQSNLRKFSPMQWNTLQCCAIQHILEMQHSAIGWFLISECTQHSAMQCMCSWEKCSCSADRVLSRLGTNRPAASPVQPAVSYDKPGAAALPEIYRHFSAWSKNKRVSSERERNTRNSPSRAYGKILPNIFTFNQSILEETS